MIYANVNGQPPKHTHAVPPQTCSLPIVLPPCLSSPLSASFPSPKHEKREGGRQAEREREKERETERVCIRKAMKLVPKMRTLDMYIDMCRC